MRLEAVGRRYGARGPWVLRDVGLELPGHQLLRVEGANGSGKSTFLRVLAGIDRPTAGRVTGRPRTAYVPERFPPALPFDALGYLVHLGRVHGLGSRTAADRAGQWLERFGIARYARTPLRELSKGTCQKVAVVQALLAEPELLLLDEAWTGLDPQARAVLDDAVRAIVAAGGTAVFVDHDVRRLAGDTTAAHRVADARLVPVPVPVPVSRDGDAGPLVVVEAEGRGEPPAGLGDGTSAPGTLRLTVPARESDAVLRRLLDANPPWHIRAVRPAAGPTEDA
ncbi:ATP-binding cassette domain-containing protein [Streptomyces sp. MI02-7b]|uniref:ABC transporter ATP-binding protein n=1 Tax=Streptomyces sp. MI02-7b TaxID=462941 RepID=UPI0029A93D1D|nr:ATP-binding cassette domain-containing protein [Streptomyces sp. MI02-7b]MDX3072311.1 ATP-binding cassette domain-containing protein [Streptomyces sp. MI02-7b]